MTVRIRWAANTLGAAGLIAILGSGHGVLAADIDDSTGIFAPGAKLTQIVGTPEGFFYEGPAMSHDGMLYFSDLTITSAKGLKSAGIIWKYDPETKKTSVYASPSGMSNGIAFDAQGRMVVVYGADYGLRMVTRTNLVTGKAEILAGEYGNHALSTPNDLTIDNKGRIWFTDPMYEHRSWEMDDQPVQGVYRIDTDGSVHLAVADMRAPNGVTMSADQSQLLVCEFDSGSHGPLWLKDDFKGTKPPVVTQLRVYDILPDGSTKFNKILYELTPDAGCDGIKVDEKGNIYMARGLYPELDVYSPEGKHIATLKIPGDGAFLLNSAWGRGKYDHTLFLAANNGVYQIETANKGSGLQ